MLKTNENFDRLLKHIAQMGDTAEVIASQSDVYRQFIEKFPLDSLPTLTLNQYCLGKGDGQSFSWWLERGLEPVFGRYSPGSARGHVLYYQPDGSIYKHRRLADLSDKKALAYTLKVQHAIASAGIQGDLDWVDNDNAIFQHAGVDPRVTVGPGRKLRLLMSYNPDQIIPISSAEHIISFVEVLGCPNEAIPSKTEPVALTQLLGQYFELAKQQYPKLPPGGFAKALYSPELGIAPNLIQEDNPSEDSFAAPMEASMYPHNNQLNLILYGPPGTGKTYATIDATLAILAPDHLAEHRNDRPKLKEKFDELANANLVRFVTFHQSFSYEDFVEGLRAETDDTTGQLRYIVANGVFKNLCLVSSTKITQQAQTTIDIKGRTIWKMSLGNTLGADAAIYDECLTGNYILLGYGGNIDFSGCKNREQIHQRYQQAGRTLDEGDYAVTSVDTFVTQMKAGDLVVVSDGNFKFRAIAEITGDYQFKPNAAYPGDYAQMRKVKWLRNYEPSLPYDELMNNQFSQMTIYRLRPKAINLDKLAALLSPSSAGKSTGQDSATGSPDTPRVLIIDEINRGNVSRIFGELITLIEPSKRAGAEEALEVVLPYSKERFSVPKNVYLIGTMNTADRSLAGLDIALRRRFVFQEMPPRPELLTKVLVEGRLNVGKLLHAMNERIEMLLDRDHCLGHAYFMPLEKTPDLNTLEAIFRNQIIPLLQEYFFEDWQRIHWVLNDHRKDGPYQFIYRDSRNAQALFGSVEGIPDHFTPWRINDDAFDQLESYLGIIDHEWAKPSTEVIAEASHNDFTIKQMKDRSILVYRNDEPFTNAMAGLTEIAGDLQLETTYENGNPMNTRNLGNLLIAKLKG